MSRHDGEPQEELKGAGQSDAYHQPVQVSPCIVQGVCHGGSCSKEVGSTQKRAAVVGRGEIATVGSSPFSHYLSRSSGLRMLGHYIHIRRVSETF